MNGFTQPLYVEPFAGGASLALSLLFKGLVSEIHLNDLDPAIYAFWHSILTRNKDFLQLVNETPVTPDEWLRQKSIYSSGPSAGEFALGFATFFLNRTNHSGILNGGMIGGKKQSGSWKIDARFNRLELQRRISLIGNLKDQIHLSSEDAIEFLRDKDFDSNSLIYLDPPYYRSGRRLYMSFYKPSDHLELRNCIMELKSPWVTSYDDICEIHTLYKTVASIQLRMLHTARTAHKGDEILFFSPGLRIPK